MLGGHDVAEKAFVAVDIGASSGRHVAGQFDGGRLRLEELYRFENGGVALHGKLYWDVLHQWSQVLAGLRAAAAKMGTSIASVGVDTWGVDFALLGRGGVLLGNPRHYRDRHTDGILDFAFQVMPRADLYEATGLQLMQINSLFQLWALKRDASPLLDQAEHFLMMPDLFHFFLTGLMGSERTNSTTTQLFDPRKGAWSEEVIHAFGLPRKIFGNILQPGDVLGSLTREACKETGLSAVKVVLPGTHDTASAVMSTPTLENLSNTPNWCYISSGTWSLMGVECKDPIISPRSQELNFTNEGGVGGSTRILKNICGLWLIQECRRRLNLGGANYDWEQLLRMSAASPPLVSLIFPDHPRFMAPDDMPGEIAAFCRETGQPAPSDPGAIVRCALESLALRYRQVLGWLESLTGAPIETVHIIGGGVNNRQLCKMTANACGKLVIAGPVEATAVGNIMMQAVAAKEVANIREAREVVRRSFDVDEYSPRHTPEWESAYARYLSLPMG